MVVSVIVPIYNVEEFLPKCIDSILTQSYTALEIILVEDGSPDNCAAICDSYAARDNRIKVLHNPNQGVARSRQEGVASASGNCILFVDSDDWLPPRAVEQLCNAMGEGVDLVIGGHYKVRGGRISRQRNASEYLTQRDYIARLIGGRKINPAPWGKLYRKSLFTAQSFPRLQKGEDYLMNLEVAARLRGVACISPAVYYYLRREGSAMCRGEATRSPLAGEEAFVEQIRATLALNGLAELYTEELTKVALRKLKRVMKQRKERLSPRTHPWVAQSLHASQGIPLTWKERLIRHSLLHPSLQPLVRLL